MKYCVGVLSDEGLPRQAKGLQDLGFSSVTAADMRIDDWIAAGHPLVKK
jgi:hypothetical protein